METLTIGKLLTKHTTGLRITNNFVTLFTHYGNFIDEEIKDYPIDAISVEYECNDLARKGFKIVNPELSLVTKQVSFPLTDEEMDTIDKWLENYWEESDFINIPLSCYDPNDSNLYKGVLPLKEIKDKKYIFTEETCDFPVGKYDPEKQEYVKVKAIIREDGSYVIDPGSYCSACIMFLTEEEWNALPPPSEEQQKYYYIRYSFKTNSWYDSRTIKEMRENFERVIKERLNSVNSDNASYYLGMSTYGSNTVSVPLNYINIENENQEENNELYQYGVESINTFFNTKITSKIDTTDKNWLLEQFKKTCKVVEGQKDAWLAIPSIMEKQKSPEFDLSIPSGWDKLIDKFDTWMESVYE